MTPQLETPILKLWKEDGIVIGEYALNLDIDIKIAREAVETRMRFAENKTCPVLVDMRGVKTISKEARAYFSDEGTKGISAAALVTGSIVTRTIAEVFMMFNKPIIPIALFGNKKDAKKWLLQFVKAEKK